MKKTNNKETQYLQLNKKVSSLIKEEANLIANLSNICAAIKEFMSFLWVGFYLVNKNELILGPFQGTIACTRIKKGEGVCGTAWEKNITIIVDNVNEFKGHIACSHLSKSEIVIPIRKQNKVYGVLDIDHDHYKTFDLIDKKYLKKIIKNIEKKLD